MLRLVLTVCALCAFLATDAAAKPAAPAKRDPLLGVWQTQEQDAAVEFYSCEDGKFCGRFYALKDDSAARPSRDDNNPDPELKKRRLCGLTFLGGFEKIETGYSSGWVYSPRHGSTYSAALTLLDDKTLELRGFMFFSFLGGSQQWTRAPKKLRPCAKFH